LRNSLPIYSAQSTEAEAFFAALVITFNVYGNEDAEERLIPFDMVPRIITAHNGAGFRAGSNSACAHSMPFA